MPSKTKPFNLSETNSIVALASESAKAWNVRLKGHSSPLLVWASTREAAASEARAINSSHYGSTVVIASIRQNYQAQNMRPRPADWRQYIFQGGEA